MSTEAKLTGISNHSLPEIINVLFDLVTTEETSSSGMDPEIIVKPWQDLIKVPVGSNPQTIISSKVDEYLDEIARQEVIWDAAGGDFTFKNPMTMQDEIRHIAKDDYIKPLGYSMDTIRIQRDKLLLECDWTQLSDSPLTYEDKSLYATYRQDLREIPQTYASDITALVWPSLNQISSSSAA